MERENFHIEPGAPMFNKGYSIIIDTKGPYFVYGKPTLRQEFIVPNAEGEAWEYKTGITYKVDHEPMSYADADILRQNRFATVHILK